MIYFIYTLYILKNSLYIYIYIYIYNGETSDAAHVIDVAISNL
jgi:hypothetical protein